MSVLDELRGKVFPVLDDGHVILIDAMGDDGAIVDAARVSYGAGTRRASGDGDLIRYLMRHRHMTPFEMCEIKLRVRVPMDCWRQWIRHRTANVNEYSTRYSEAIDAMQATDPAAWRAQATDNKQGSGAGAIGWPSGAIADACMDTFGPAATAGQYLSVREDALQDLARVVYRERLDAGVAREQARKDLPLSTYTEAYWKCDLRNVLGFLALRMDGHAQREIREYANVIGREIVAPLFPDTWRAFVDYHLDAMTLSGREVGVIGAITDPGGLGPEDAMSAAFANRRERDECRAKLARLGLIPPGGERP